VLEAACRTARGRDRQRVNNPICRTSLSGSAPATRFGLLSARYRSCQAESLSRRPITKRCAFSVFSSRQRTRAVEDRMDRIMLDELADQPPTGAGPTAASEVCAQAASGPGGFMALTDAAYRSGPVSHRRQWQARAGCQPGVFAHPLLNFLPPVGRATQGRASFDRHHSP